MQSLIALRAPLQLRGEAWREVTTLVREQRRDGETVWLDSQLIEASVFAQSIRQVGELSSRAANGRQIGIFAAKFPPMTADNTERAAAV